MRTCTRRNGRSPPCRRAVSTMAWHNDSSCNRSPLPTSRPVVARPTPSTDTAGTSNSCAIRVVEGARSRQFDRGAVAFSAARGEAEDALAEDVVLDLVGAAGDAQAG